MTEQFYDPVPVPPELWRLRETSMARLRAETDHTDALFAAEAAGLPAADIEWWAKGTGWDEWPDSDD